MRPTLALLRADLVRVGRDELLVWILAVPLVMALAARLVLRPWLLSSPYGAGWLARLDAAAFVVVVPALVGTVVGFLILSDKEDRVWDALAVTPWSLRGYLAWRAAGAGLVTMVACPVCLQLGGLNDLPAASTLLVALAAAPLASATTLALAAWLSSTLQGIAAVKLGLAVLVLPAALLGVPAGSVLAVIPSWWPVRAYAAAPSGQSLLWSLGSWLVCLVISAAALSRTGSAHRGSSQLDRAGDRDAGRDRRPSRPVPDGEPEEPPTRSGSALEER